MEQLLCASSKAAFEPNSLLDLSAQTMVKSTVEWHKAVLLLTKENYNDDVDSSERTPLLVRDSR